MKFLTKEQQNDQFFSLVYRSEDYSFDVEPLDGTGDSSIMVNDLQLEIDDQGIVMYAWGLCPLIDCHPTKNFPKKYRSVALIAVLDKPPVLGISYRINEYARWPLYVNKKKGWVCVGNPETKSKELVEFAPDCIATLENNEIIAIWLHPNKLPDNIAS